MSRTKTGFTLVELLITMAILGVALMAISNTFVGLVNHYKQQSKLAETNIEGIIGLEILRQDMERAGYGLPWVVPATYSEAVGAPASNYNDAPNPPRPIMSDNNYTAGMNNGSNYPDLLVIKAANLARYATSQSWTYLTTGATNLWDVASENPAVTDYVVVLSPGLADTDARTLVVAGTPAMWAPLFRDIVNFQPGASDPQPRFVYDIYDSESYSRTPPRMPFNRADYYVLGPGGSLNVPSRCAPGTGVLVKSLISQKDGSRADVLPLLDCVADMKVIFRLDRNGDGNLSPTDVLNDTLGAPLTARQIRAQVKEVRVYILAHEGQQDRNFTYSRTTIYVGDPGIDSGLGHSYNIGAKVHYRWKLYTIVVQPKNMRQS